MHAARAHNDCSRYSPAAQREVASLYLYTVVIIFCTSPRCVGVSVLVTQLRLRGGLSAVPQRDPQWFLSGSSLLPQWLFTASAVIPHFFRSGSSLFTASAVVLQWSSSVFFTASSGLFFCFFVFCFLFCYVCPLPCWLGKLLLTNAVIYLPRTNTSSTPGTARRLSLSIIVSSCRCVIVPCRM